MAHSHVDTRGAGRSVGGDGRNDASAERVKVYALLVVLFLASLLMFFVGAIIGSVPLALAGFLLTFSLFLARRLFKWEQQ